MKRMILTAGCLVVSTSLAACGSSQENDPTADLTGSLPAAEAVQCVDRYSPTTVVDRAFAFDGVVTDIGSAGSDRSDRGHLELVGVTFAVREWFAGGSASTVTVDMEPPVQGAPQLPEGVPSYAVGSRLLVSGEPRWGGPPLQDAIAWGCDFTRYYDPVTAESWRRAFADAAG